MFTAGGIPAVAKDLWPDALSSIMNSGRVPFGRRVFARLVAPSYARHVLDNIPPQGIAWILGPAVPRTADPKHEQRLKQRGVRYVFHVMDDWLEVEYLRKATIERVSLADLIVVPTPALASKISAHFPSKKVVNLEEPIDIDRVSPKPPSPDTHHQPPVIVWTGNQGNLDLLRQIAQVLEIIAKKHPFKLRIISTIPPAFSFSFNWEWLRYDYQTESDLLAGALIGLAPLNDTPYNNAKGVYKVKTYLAAGIVPVGAPVGYINHLIQHGENGFICGSSEQWIQNLSFLLTNHSARNLMALNARQSALAKYSHAAIATQWVAAVKNNILRHPDVLSG
jgi:glycosyltransferase involved in cell wall biosynthesis